MKTRRTFQPARDGELMSWTRTPADPAHVTAALGMAVGILAIALAAITLVVTA